jgi:hypothetical protein
MTRPNLIIMIFFFDDKTDDDCLGYIRSSTAQANKAGAPRSVNRGVNTGKLSDEVAGCGSACVVVPCIENKEKMSSECAMIMTI